VGLAAAFPIAIVVSGTLMVGFDTVVTALFGKHTVWLYTSVAQGRITKISMGLVMLAAAATAAFVPYALLVTRAIRKRVTEVSCPACQYVLIGLEVKDDAVRCPECGKDIVLSDFALRREDIELAVVERTTKPPARWTTFRRFWLLASIPGVMALLWGITGKEWFITGALITTGLLLYGSIYASQLPRGPLPWKR